MSVTRPQKPRTNGSKMGTDDQDATVPAKVMGRRNAVDDTRNRKAPHNQDAPISQGSSFEEETA
jgi:hypothetical protein